MIANFNNLTTKEEVINTVKEFCTSHELEIIEENIAKPWGGYLRFSDESAAKFISLFFNPGEIENDDLYNISPKILIIAPHARLSWQYHHRRSEIWKVVEGKVGIMLSDDDAETSMTSYGEGAIIRVKKENRHRLAGFETWGILAEIWQHTDPQNPSDEEDIVRIGDDFGRQGSTNRN